MQILTHAFCVLSLYVQLHRSTCPAYKETRGFFSACLLTHLPSLYGQLREVRVQRSHTFGAPQLSEK